MTFLDYVKKHYPSLNPTQFNVVKILDSGISEANINFLFDGKKACPYRIVQRVWEEYNIKRSLYAKYER